MGLVTLALAKADLDIPDATTTEDTRIQKFVDAASEYIENECNRKFLQATYTNERYDGNDTRYLLLRQFPVTSITSIYLDDDWVFGAGTEIVAGKRQTYRDCMVVRQCGVYQYTNALAVKVTYQAGFATIPTDIQQATLDMVLWLYAKRNDRRSGLTARSKLGENASYEDVVPASVTAMIAKHKRDAYIADKLSIFDPAMVAKIKGESLAKKQN